MEIKTIYADITTIKGINQAERQKRLLENKGFRLIRETCLFTQARLTYSKGD